MPQPFDIDEGGRERATLVYAYGIVRGRNADGHPNLAALAGIDGAPLRLYPAADIAAVISILNIPGGASALATALEDPERAKSMILDHYRVLQFAIEDCTVLPLRFGAVFTGETALAAALEKHRDGFLKALARMNGAREWGVKIFCDRKRFEESLRAETPALRAAETGLAAVGQGRAFFAQRQLARRLDEETRRAIAVCVDEVRKRLAGVVRAETALKIQPSSVHGRTDDMVWNGAMLVAKSGENAFFEAFDALRREKAGRGFSFEAGGPWPAFSFADARLGDEAI
jgi:hypothetical protein